MQLVVAEYPVGAEQRSVGSGREADRSKIFAAGDERFGERREARSLRLQTKAVDAVVAPACDQQVAEILLRQAVRFVGHDAGGGFAGPRDHRQRAGNLAVPRREGVQTFAAVAEAVAVIASSNHMQQAARRATVGIVVHSEEPSERIEAARVRIPKPGRDLAQLRTIQPAPINVATLAAPAERRAVRTDDLVVGPQIFAEPEVHPAERINRKAGQSVVRIIPLSVEPHNRLFAIGFVVAVIVMKEEDLSCASRHKPTASGQVPLLPQAPDTKEVAPRRSSRTSARP